MSSVFLEYVRFMTKKKTKKDTKAVANKIKLAMLESGFNQLTLAKELGLTQSAVSKWLNGASAVSMKSLYAIAALTGKPVNYFFDNSTEVHGDGNVVGKNIKASADVQKDIKLLSAQVELLTVKMQLMEKEIKALKKAQCIYPTGDEG